MSSFKNIKLEAWNEEHSKAIQDELFRLGYRWADGNGRKYHPLNPSFIDCGEDGLIRKCSSPEEFLSRSQNGSTLVELKAMPTPKRKVKKWLWRKGTHASTEFLSEEEAKKLGDSWVKITWSEDEFEVEVDDERN